MSHEQVSSTIRRGFAGIVMQGNFKFLDCLDNKLKLSEEQQPDGSVIINRKSAVYLMQTVEQVCASIWPNIINLLACLMFLVSCPSLMEC